ncbi:helix-turn-helix transcriptional regulator [Aliidiomarina shirensis]|nr:WYL domain-containing protein [Aliidiomarina shirensis]
MTTNSARMTITRQWELLKLLPNRSPGVTSRDLERALVSEGFEVSKRTVERDLSELRRLFPIICNAKGKPYGWYWAKDASIDMPGLSVAEALSLSLIEQIMKPLIPKSVMDSVQPRFRQAKKTLNGLKSPQKLSCWTEKVAHVPVNLVQQPPAIKPQVLETVQNALLHENVLEVKYQSLRKQEISDLRLHPLGLVQRAAVTYLVASSEPYDQPRLFALQRIEKAKPTDIKATSPDGFSLQNYLDASASQFDSGKDIVLKVRLFSDEVVRSLTESPISDEQEIREDEDGAVLIANVKDSWQIRWWLLSYAELVEVLAPKELRAEAARRLALAAERYANS